jgi:predicted permease
VRHLLQRLRMAIRALWHRERIEQELDEELQSFLDATVDDKMRSGMTREQAVRAARLQIGSEPAIKEAVREVGWEARIETTWRDVAYAARSLARSPAFSAVAVLTLGIGIAATTAIFSIVHGVLIEPLPYPHSERMVRLFMNAPPSESPSKRQYRGPLGLTADQMNEVRTRVRSLSHVGTSAGTLRGLRGKEEAARLQGARVSASLFELIEARPVLGRRFLAADEVAGAEPVVIISYNAWQRFFAANPSIVGTSITMDSALGPRVEFRYTVIGVMPPTFAYPDNLTYFWLPFQPLSPTGTPQTGWVVARLADGASVAAAEAEVTAVLRALRPQAPETRYELTYEHRELVQPVRQGLMVLMGAVGFVLLIACVNVANLLLARTAARRHEMAVRVAIGAGRSRLIRQMLTESLLLAALGGIAGTALAIAAIRVLKTLATTMARIDVSPGGFPRIDSIELDLPVLAFTFTCCLVTGILFGIVPAVLSSQVDPVRSLKGDWTGERKGRLRFLNLRHALVVAEVALAMVLLVGGALLARSFANLSAIEPGYSADNVLTFQVSLPVSGYSNPRLRAFAEDVVSRLRLLPGVQAAAYANQLPMVNLSDTAGGLWPTPDPKRAPTPIGPDARFISRDYFNVFGIRILRGRGLTEADDEGHPRVLLVNQALVNRDFEGQDPIGRTVFVGRDVQPWEIVGVVDDVRQFALDRDPAPQFFADLRQWSGQGAFFPIGAYYAIRTTTNGEQLLPAIREIVAGLDQEAALFSIAPMRALVANTIARPRLYASLLSAFAVAGLTLALIGIYGVVGYTVAQRTREIGIRVSLGAARRDVIALMMRQSLALTAAGIAVGLGAAAGISRYLESLLFGVTRFDATTFAVVVAAFTIVAALATYIPARRATKVDPLVALRSN